MIDIAGRKIGKGFPCYLIAEIGSNQNRDLSTAYKLIDMAFEAGVDAVKFQTLKPNDIAKQDTKATAYGERVFTKGNLYWSDVLKQFVLPYEWHSELFEYARSKGLTPISTPESLEAVEFLEKLNIPAYKIASMDITYTQLLQKVASTSKPVILSTGIADNNIIDEAISILKKNGTKQIALLHCVADYPPDIDTLSLELIGKYKQKFRLNIGFSDHLETNIFDIAAVALGANIIEKHITLDKNQSGPDHSFALDKNGLNDLVYKVRATEKALPEKKLLYEKKEAKRTLFGRSIIICPAKKKDDPIMYSDIDIKRPGTGILPKYFSEIIGKKMNKNTPANHILSWNDLK